MSKQDRHPFYTSKEWEICREGFMASKRYLCERCLSKGIIKPAVIAHHKTFLTNENVSDPEIALNWNNLMAVCRDCHGELHRTKKRYKVDEYGRVIDFDDPT